MRALALALCLTTAPALAEDRMTAAEFDAYTRGLTFTYHSMGRPYGAEEYRDGRRVRWSFLDGRCMEGEWYEAGDLICFVYDEEPGPQCWTFSEGADGLIARFANTPGTDEVYEAQRSAERLSCPGPDVGA